GTGRRWCDKLTQDEVDHLVRHGRLWRLTHVFLESPTRPMTREEMLGFIAGNHPAADPIEFLAQALENGLIVEDAGRYRQLRGPVRRPGAPHPTAHQVNTQFAQQLFGHDSINRS